jgi:hypothetical protein
MMAHRDHDLFREVRREKVFKEMRRPVFALLSRGPLSQNCTFMSYDSVCAIGSLQHLVHANDTIIADYEERKGD